MFSIAKLFIAIAALALSACAATLTTGGNPVVIPTVESIRSQVQPATVGELRQNALRAAPYMVNCITEASRNLVAPTLTRAQIVSATTTADAGALPSGCTSARPPRGTVPVIVERTLSKNGERVWLVDMYYPSSPNKPWFYVLGDLSVIQNPYFGGLRPF